MTAPNNPRGRRVPTIGTVIPARADRDWVTGPELAIEAQITYRQLDYWTRTGLLVPLDDPVPGSGIIRRFPLEQIERAAALRHLLNAGVSLPVCRHVIDELLTTGTATSGAVTFHLHLNRDTTSTGAATA